LSTPILTGVAEKRLFPESGLRIGGADGETGAGTENDFHGVGFCHSIIDKMQACGQIPGIGQGGMKKGLMRGSLRLYSKLSTNVQFLINDTNLKGKSEEILKKQAEGDFF
jgi:hypothetical protein